ncbi:hypothetical protein GCM10027341_47660 [Spirosoma knui]
MGWLTRTTDWQVCCVGQAAAGVGVATGSFLFIFYSRTAGVSGIYGFGGLGIGLGGNASGVVNPANLGAVSSPWTQLYRTTPYICGLREFNSYDLNGAAGRITYTGAGAFGVTYGGMYISASPWGITTNAYFYSQPIYGAGFGAPGVGAGSLSGNWSFVAETRIHP